MIDGRCSHLLARLVFQDLIFGTPSCEILHSSRALTIVQIAKYCIHVISTATPRPILNLTIDQCLELISFGNVMMVSLIVTIREFSPGWRHVCHGGCACS